MPVRFSDPHFFRCLCLGGCQCPTRASSCLEVVFYFLLVQVSGPGRFSVPYWCRCLCLEGSRFLISAMAYAGSYMVLTCVDLGACVFYSSSLEQVSVPGRFSDPHFFRCLCLGGCLCSTGASFDQGSFIVFHLCRFLVLGGYLLLTGYFFRCLCLGGCLCPTGASSDPGSFFVSHLCRFLVLGGYFLLTGAGVCAWKVLGSLLVQLPMVGRFFVPYSFRPLCLRGLQFLT